MRRHRDLLFSKAPVRYLISGGVNTGITYLFYLLLLLVLPYGVAYSISFAVGVGLAYFINLKFVFRTTHSLKKSLLYPVIYLIQYGVGLGILNLAVFLLELPKEIALLLAMAINVPLGYFLNGMLLRGGSKPLERPALTARRKGDV